MKKTDDVPLWLSIATILFLPGFYLLNGFVLQRLFGWFVTPVFGVAVPAIGYCIGLGLIVSFLTNHGTDSKDERGSTEKLSALWSRQVFAPLFVWGLGALIHWLTVKG